MKSLHLPRRQGSVGYVGVRRATERPMRLTEHSDDIAGATGGDRLASLAEELRDPLCVDVDLSGSRR